MKFLSASGRLLLLGGLAYLGLYVYGLVMEVFDPLELVGFTVVAGGVLVAYAIHLIRFRRSMDDPQERRELNRELNEQRERRGFQEFPDKQGATSGSR